MEIDLKTCLAQIEEEKRNKDGSMKRQTIRIVSIGRDRRVYLDPEGILLTCVQSVDVHVDLNRQSLVMTIPDNCFEVDVQQNTAKTL